MNDSDNNNVTKVIIGIIIAVLVIIVAVYAYNMLKDDNSLNDVKNDMNNTTQNMENTTQDIYNGTSNMLEGAGNVASDIAKDAGNVVGDVVDGAKNAVDNVIDFTMTENADITDNMKTNTSEKIRKDKNFESLVFKEVTLVGRDNVTTFTAKIKNDSNNDFIAKDVTVTFFKKDGTTITTTRLNIPNIKSNETSEVTVDMDEDVANAYDYTIE